MRRRQLLTVPPVLSLAACSGPSSDPSAGDTGTGASDGGGRSDAGGRSDGGGAAPTPEPSSAAELLLEDLSPRELAGQLVLVGITAGGSVPPEARDEHHVGGFFLLGRWESAADVDAVVGAAHEGGREDLPPLLAVDQEGGQIRMLRGDAARSTPSAAELGAAGPDATEEAYATIGEDLAARGLHAALSPVADVVDPELGAANGPVGAHDRGFGTAPGPVSDCVDAAVRALDGQGIAATLKHFPGLGRVEENTDYSAEGIVDDEMTAEDPYLDPFTAGIAAGSDLVMLASAIYPQIEPDVPAMFSRPVVHDLLREQLGFDGLIVTDDIGSAVAVADVPVPDRATRLLEAGGDAVLTADPALAGELVDAIADWAETSADRAEHVRRAAGRMLAVKERRGVLPG